MVGLGVDLQSGFEYQPIRKTKQSYSPINKKEKKNGKKCVFLFCVCMFPFVGFNPEIGKLGAGVRTSHSETERVEINTTDESYIHLPKAMIDVAQVK